jgi:hypothetical protein
VHPRTWGPDEVRYEFVLAEVVSDEVLAVFPDLEAVPGPVGGTVMYGRVEDASHLHGLLDRFGQLGLTVLEMRRLPD